MFSWSGLEWSEPDDSGETGVRFGGGSSVMGDAFRRGVRLRETSLRFVSGREPLTVQQPFTHYTSGLFNVGK